MTPEPLTTPQFNRTGFTRCNTIGHAWFDHADDGAFTPLTPGINEVLFLTCERCDTRRRDVMDTHGGLLYRTYRYPDGYKYGRGERPSRSEFRVMLLAQQLAEARKMRRVK